MGEHNLVNNCLTALLSIVLVAVVIGFGIAIYLKMHPSAPSPTSVAAQASTEAATAPPGTAAATPIPGWKKFEGFSVELWLPQEYVGGDPGTNPDVSAKAFRANGYSALADTIESNSLEPYLFIAFDPRTLQNSPMTSVTIMHKLPGLASHALDLILDGISSGIKSPNRLTGRKIISLAPYEAGRLIVNYTHDNDHSTLVMYVIKTPNLIWEVTFEAAASEIDKLLPMFDQSITTFKIQGASTQPAATLQAAATDPSGHSSRSLLDQLKNYKVRITANITLTQKGKTQRLTLQFDITRQASPLAASYTTTFSDFAPIFKTFLGVSMAQYLVAGTSTYVFSNGMLYKTGAVIKGVRPATQCQKVKAADDSALIKALSLDEPDASGLTLVQPDDPPIYGIPVKHYYGQSKSASPAQETDMWVSADSKQRLIRYRYEITGSGSNGQMSGETQYDLLAADQPVTVDLPKGCSR